MTSRSDSTYKLFQALCEAVKLPPPQPEFKFHPDRKWRIDYYFEANGVRVGLEVEGGVWSNGRHTRGKGFIADIEKYNAMSEAGIWLVRTVPSELLKMKTVLMIKNILDGNG